MNEENARLLITVLITDENGTELVEKNYTIADALAPSVDMQAAVDDAWERRESFAKGVSEF